MTTAIAVFLRVYSGDTTHASWQNFFVNKTVDNYAFKAFDISDILMNRTADEGGVTICMAATLQHLTFFETAIGSEYLAEVKIYELPVTTDLPTDLGSASLISRFVGEVMIMQTNLVELSVELGAAIDAVSGDIPGRKITTSLVGRLPSL